MMWRTHVMCGIASLWLIVPIPGAVSPDSIGLLCAAASFGALLPDLDAAESKIKHISVVGIKPFALPSIALHSTFRHRGAMHSLRGLGIIAVLASPFALYGWPVWGALLLGYASHLAADACTPAGIPLFLNFKRIHLLPKRMRIVTGSDIENIVFVLFAALSLCLLLMHLPTLA